MSGYYEHLVAERNRVLANVRMSRADRARALGLPFFRPPPKSEAKAAAPKREPRPQKRPGLGPRAAIPARVGQVIAAFTEVFEVELDGVLSHSHKRYLARPRQAAMHFLHVEMKLSSNIVGKVMKRDHSTVFHARNVVADRLRDDPDFSARYHRAARAIRALWSEK